MTSKLEVRPYYAYTHLHQNLRHNNEEVDGRIFHNGFFTTYCNNVSGSNIHVDFCGALESRFINGRFSESVINNSVLDKGTVHNIHLNQFVCRRSFAKGSAFTDVVFRSGEVYSCTLEDCIINRCAFSSNLMNVTLERCLVSYGTFSDLTASNIRILNGSLTKTIFSGVQFVYSISSATKYVSCSFVDCRFVNPLFQKTSYDGCYFNNVKFYLAHANSPKFTDCTFKDVTFTSGYSTSLYMRCKFENTKFEAVDFGKWPNHLLTQNTKGVVFVSPPEDSQGIIKTGG